MEERYTLVATHREMVSVMKLEFNQSVSDPEPESEAELESE